MIKKTFEAKLDEQMKKEKEQCAAFNQILKDLIFQNSDSVFMTMNTK